MFAIRDAPCQQLAIRRAPCGPTGTLGEMFRDSGRACRFDRMAHGAWRTLQLAFALTAGLAECGHAQTPPRWPVDRTPITAIGSAEGSPDLELANVSGARRLSDGRVVIANGKPLELRVFDLHGALVMRIGRRGSGPGEFAGRLDLLSAGGDSILVYDQGSERLMLFRPDGKLAREWPPTPGSSGSLRGGTVLFRQSFARGSLPSATGCLKRVLSLLPPVEAGAIRDVVPDNSGRYYVRIDRSPVWAVHDGNGKPIGSVTLPPKFDLMQAGNGWVIGRALIEDDVEQVQVLRVTPPASARAVGSCTVPPEAFPAAESARVAEFKLALRAAMTSGEMAYSDVASYVSSLDSLPGLRAKLPAGSVFRVISASNRGWSGAIFDKRSTLVCAFGMASEAPVGWSDGRVRCSE